VTTTIAVLGSLVGLAAFLTAIQQTARWLSERKSNEIGAAVGQLGTLLDRFREENETLVDLNGRQAKQIETQGEQIEELKRENEKLDILVRSLTQQNVDVAADRERVRRERDQLMREYHELIGRLREHEDRGGQGAA
jgi:chromosome segregation ATPase